MSTNVEKALNVSEQEPQTRKSTFTKRQKFFVRNFLEDQFSVNQYYLFPGNKNPLVNKNAPSQLIRAHTMVESLGRPRTERNKKLVLTASLRSKEKTATNSNTNHKSAPQRRSSKFSARDEDNEHKLPDIYPPESNTSSDFLKDITFLNKKIIVTNVNERENLLDSEIKRLNMKATSIETIRRERRLRKRTLSERFAVRMRFKRAVRKLIIVLSLLEIHKIQVQRMLLKQCETWIHRTFQETILSDEKDYIFDKHYYSRPKEPKFPDEAKRILKLKSSERTDEMLRFVQLSLNFCVPEFLTFPLHMQRKIAQLAFYQEFEPSRVIIRQGHIPLYYYIILSGTAIISTTMMQFTSSNQLLEKLKRGDCYGEVDLIKNQLRQHTITVYGNIPIGLLIIESEDFFQIQTPVLSVDERHKFLCNRVNFFKLIAYPVQKLRNVSKFKLFSIYYRMGHIVCEESVNDEWIYIVRSGTCRVLKKVRFDHTALSFFQDESQSKREINAQKQIMLDNADHHSEKNFVEYERNGNKFTTKTNNTIRESVNYSKKDQFTYLEVKKLSEGDTFGIHDIVFNDPKEVNSLILVSDGAEIILLSRVIYMDLCDGEAMLRMRFNLPPYPNNESFIVKYFSYLQWGNFKHKVTKTK